MENNEKKSDQNIDKKINDTDEKIVNLFEDTGNFHDEEKLSKSYEKIDKK